MLIIPNCSDISTLIISGENTENRKRRTCTARQKHLKVKRPIELTLCC